MNKQEQNEFVENFFRLVMSVYQQAQLKKEQLKLPPNLSRKKIYDNPIQDQTSEQKKKAKEAFREQHKNFDKWIVKRPDLPYLSMKAFISADNYLVISIKNKYDSASDDNPIDISYLAMKVIERKLNENNPNRINESYRLKLTGLNYDQENGFNSGISAESLYEFLKANNFAFPYSFKYNTRGDNQGQDRDKRGKIKLINDEFLNRLKRVKICKTKGATNEKYQYEEYPLDAQGKPTYSFYGGASGKSYEMYFLLFNELETPNDIEENIKQYFDILDPPPPNDPLYIERYPVVEDEDGYTLNKNGLTLEKKACKELMKPCSLLKIQGTKGMGKSSFVSYICNSIMEKENNYKIITYDCNTASQICLQEKNYHKFFFKEMCSQLLEQLQTEIDDLSSEEENQDILDKYFKNPISNITPSSIISSINFIANHLLSQISDNDNLVIIFENLDNVFASKIYVEFCQLMRSLSEKSAINSFREREKNLWKKLRLVIVHSTEVYAFSDDIHYSPLEGVGEPFLLREFVKQEVQQFFEINGLCLDETKIKKIFNLIGGDLNLLKIMYENLSKSDKTFDSILEEADTQRGIYGRYFTYLESCLISNNTLADAVNSIRTQPDGIELNTLQAFKLISLGLIKYTGKGNLVTFKNNLYKSYFKQN